MGCCTIAPDPSVLLHRDMCSDPWCLFSIKRLKMGLCLAHSKEKPCTLDTYSPCTALRHMDIEDAGSRWRQKQRSRRWRRIPPHPFFEYFKTSSSFQCLTEEQWASLASGMTSFIAPWKRRRNAVLVCFCFHTHCNNKKKHFDTNRKNKIGWLFMKLLYQCCCFWSTWGYNWNPKQVTVV